MIKRKGKIIVDDHSGERTLIEGGNDFDYCVKLFLDELEIETLLTIPEGGIRKIFIM